MSWYIDEVKTNGQDKIGAMQSLVSQLLYLRDMLLVAYPSDIFIENEYGEELNLFKDE